MPASLPVWVPAVLLVLVALGYRLSLTRTVRPVVLCGIAAAMFGYSLYGVATAFGLAPLVLLVWLVAYAAAALGGAKWLPQGRMVSVGKRVSVPGSWAPMGLLLGIFAARCVLGFAVGVRSPILHNPSFVLVMSAILGMLSGVFGARALVVYRFVRNTGAA